MDRGQGGRPDRDSRARSVAKLSETEFVMGQRRRCPLIFLKTGEAAALSNAARIARYRFRQQNRARKSVPIEPQERGHLAQQSANSTEPLRTSMQRSGRSDCPNVLHFHAAMGMPVGLRGIGRVGRLSLPRRRLGASAPSDH